MKKLDRQMFSKCTTTRAFFCSKSYSNIFSWAGFVEMTLYISQLPQIPSFCASLSIQVVNRNQKEFRCILIYGCLTFKIQASTTSETEEEFTFTFPSEQNFEVINSVLGVLGPREGKDHFLLTCYYSLDLYETIKTAPVFLLMIYTCMFIKTCCCALNRNWSFRFWQPLDYRT